MLQAINRREEELEAVYHRCGLQPCATLVTLVVHLAVLGWDTVMLLRGGRRRRRRLLASSEPLNWCSCRPKRGSEEVTLGPHEVPPIDTGGPKREVALCCKRVALCSSPTRPFPSSFNWCHRSSSPLADWPGGR